MICLTCLHSLTQTFVNGEMTSDTVFCKVLMRDMKGNLVKCGGYDEKKVEYVNFTPYNPPSITERIDPSDPLGGIPSRSEIREMKNLKTFDEFANPVFKPLTRSERMKEYWRNRKSGNAKDGTRTDG